MEIFATMGLHRSHRPLTMLAILLTTSYVFCRDLTQEPGHLKPFGEGRPSHLIQEVEGFPKPEEFFSGYVKPLIPLKMKGAAMLFPAFHKWTDDYFLSIKEPSDHFVAVETVKKESRKQKMLSMQFKEFVRKYNDSTYYMVSAVPPFIRKDVLVPCSLQCRSIIENSLADTVMWFSNGGTNSVVHTDSFDNMNCLLRGNKTLVMVDPSLYRDKVDIDHPEGSYSNVDVDSVDYLKYPGLADVEFYHVNVTAGDCLYIPYKWIHQVRSYGSNIAVNLWWHHYLREDINFDECRQECDTGVTLNDADFGHSEAHGMAPEEIRDHFQSLISLSEPLNFPRFARKLVGGMTSEDVESNTKLKTGLMQIFTLVDMNKDGVITSQEITDTHNETYEEVWSIMIYLEKLMEDGEQDEEYYDEDEPPFDMDDEEEEDLMNYDDIKGDLDNMVEDDQSVYFDGTADDYFQNNAHENEASESKMYESDDDDSDINHVNKDKASVHDEF